MRPRDVKPSRWTRCDARGPRAVPSTLALLLLALSCSGPGCREDGPPEHLERARLALFERKPDLALAEFKRALDASERLDAPEAAVYRARALRGAADTYYLELREPARAMEVYRELVERCPEAPETMEGRVHLATVLHRDMRDLRGAITELEGALLRNPPRGAELKYRVAALYFELQDYLQVDIETAELLVRFHDSAWADDALLLRGQALASIEGRELEAQRAFMELVDRHSTSGLKPHALFELGQLRARQGDTERAIELWVESLKTHPNPGLVQKLLARARARLLATTPGPIGDSAVAFDRVANKVVTAAPLARRGARPVTSLEALGAPPDEVAREAAGEVDGVLGGGRPRSPSGAGATPPGVEAAEPAVDSKR